MPAIARQRSAVVIGAGPNGLACAIALADAGLAVTVLEASTQPGGSVSSGADTLPGFVHDRCAAFFPLAAASPVFRELGLERHGLEWIDPPVPLAHPLRDGRAVVLRRDLASTCEELERFTAGAGRRWAELAEPLLEDWELLARAALSTFPAAREAGRLAQRLGARRAARLCRLALGSAVELGERVLGDAALTAWLCGAVAHSDLSPRARVSGAVALSLQLLGHAVGWPLPRGGAGALSAAMARRLAAAGGSIRCDAVVEQVDCATRGVRGVRLAGGEPLGADVVVATISAGPLVAMLPAHDAGAARLRRLLRRWRYGLGTLKLDWALSAPVPWLAPAAREAAVVHLGDSVDDYLRAHREATLGRFPRRPCLLVGQQSLHDPTRAPAGRHTLYAYARIAADPKLDGEAAAEAVQRRIETFAPGFSASVLARRHRTPHELQRHNRSLVGGDLAGGSMTLGQQLLFRPAPSLVRHRTPVRGLYLGGASVHPGPGVHGAAGAGAAQAVLGDLARR